MLRWIFLICGIMSLCGCGQTGPLYLPPKPNEPAKLPAPTPVPIVPASPLDTPKPEPASVPPAVPMTAPASMPVSVPSGGNNVP